ncbi:MAG: hypothetical protein F8N39_19420 [Clostridiaceae bacterium]|nr:hypothetical protein [Clostridiaceae bacterium]
MNKNFLILGIILTTVIAISGCTSQSNTVTINNMAFSPSTLTIPAGTTVTWINKDNTAHEVVSDTGLFDSGILAAGDSFNYTFNNAGNYEYHDSINHSLIGIITVSSSSSANNGNSTVNPLPSTPTSNNPSTPNSPSPSPAPSNPGGNIPGY